MYPKVKSVKVVKDTKLEIIFEGDIKRIYDCYRIMQKEPFNCLKDKALFKNVRVDSGGYGISWNDDIDLSESELWIHGKNI
jgi:hypothetical protein